MEIRSVAILGGLGFVGSRIVKHLHEKYPHCLITILDTRLPLSSGASQYVKHVQADITCPSSIEEALLAIRPQAVIHAAAIVPSPTDRYHRRLHKSVFVVNVEGTRNVLQAAKAAGVEALVYTSSCTAVTDDFTRSYANIDERWPLVEPGKGTSYGESKVRAEQLVHSANTTTDVGVESVFKTCSLRLAVVFGEGERGGGQQLLPSIVDLIRDKDQSIFCIGDGANIWDVVYVGNAADAHIVALENLLSEHPTAAGEVFFIQNNEPVSIRDLMLFVWKEFNGHIPRFQIQIPVSLAWVMGALGEAYTWLTGRPAGLSRGSVMDVTATRYASGEKARRVLGYEPRVGLEEALRRSCQDFAAKLRAIEKSEESSGDRSRTGFTE